VQFPKAVDEKAAAAKTERAFNSLRLLLHAGPLWQFPREKIGISGGSKWHGSYIITSSSQNTCKQQISSALSFLQPAFQPPILKVSAEKKTAEYKGGGIAW